MRPFIHRFALVLLFISLVFSSINPAGSSVNAAATASVTLPASPLPYAPDYSTTVWGDAWDMSQYSDISTYLNGGGRHVSLSNPAVNQGLFSATSLGDYTKNLSFFFLLYPYYAPGIPVGRLGRLHPIKSSQYSCIYLAMKVDSPALVKSGVWGDGYRVNWYKNENMVQGTSPNGTSVDVKTNVEDGWVDPYPIRNWKLFKMDLTNPPNGIYGTRWQDGTEWQGLEITPTLFSNVNFQVDWVKLTNNCSAEAQYQASISFTPSASINTIWINPEGTNRNIRVATDVVGTSGRYTLDTKGLASGRYRVGFGDITTCCSLWSTTVLEINSPAMVTINRPSTTSGVDYATSAGNPWDMDPTDLKSVECATPVYSGGLLDVTTQYPANLPYSCRGSAPMYESDPKMYLNTPVTIPPNSGYRYLSYRMYQNGAWQLLADGMIVRWLWIAGGCYYVSNDIPTDVGWNTYSIDLYDTFNGTPVMVTPPCTQLTQWKNSPAITAFRLDPNENYTGVFAGDAISAPVPPMVFDQKFDWIKLTKMDTVKTGVPFPIGFEPDKSLPVTAFHFYYTTTPSIPKQNVANPVMVNYAAAAGQKRSFLPMVSSPVSVASGSSIYQWDTTGVAPGQYYICVETNDGLNITTACSNAPVAVTN